MLRPLTEDRKDIKMNKLGVPSRELCVEKTAHFGISCSEVSTLESTLVVYDLRTSGALASSAMPFSCMASETKLMIGLRYHPEEGYAGRKEKASPILDSSWGCEF